uniref:Uncharacterized protein n=1 Tax=Branchiostoma floridae TaxID=7739 RepID=C3YI72_BRAFL|eukprot:XP_002604198.1 hypothetical protein BRAFLDRAFT_73460 [Branchiostoma floridae]
MDWSGWRGCLKKPCVLHVIKQVGLLVAIITEGGKAFISTSARIAAAWRKTGVLWKLEKYQDTWIRQNYPAARYKRATVSSLNKMADAHSHGLREVFSMTLYHFSLILPLILSFRNKRSQNSTFVKWVRVWWFEGVFFIDISGASLTVYDTSDWQNCPEFYRIFSEPM